jgi:uncharacterized surface protein with fasciclin (FAS1) repeats
MGEGLAIRKKNAHTFLDSVTFIQDPVLFTSNGYWERFHSKGLYLVDNEETPFIQYFTPANMATRGITGEDFSIITNGLSYVDGDIYVNGIKIVQQDIICKNGYIHVLGEVLLPARNMAQTIRDNGETNLFSRLMNKFSLPYYAENISDQIIDYYNGAAPDRQALPSADSIFVKRYFTDNFNIDPDGSPLSNYGLLYYDPTNNGYNNEQDMGAMFVPTNEALSAYFDSPKGKYLKDAYGNWENIPTSILALFVKNHQKKSFIGSLPHTWGEMNDEASFPMNVKKSDIKKTYIANNGVVYISNAVYPPVDYQCVYAPTLTSPQTKIMNWGIQEKTMKFYLYLRSMENMYNLIVPTDEAFQNYRDPISWAKNTPEIWDFYYTPERDMVFADVYNVDSDGNKAGLKKSYTQSATDQAIIRNRLTDIIDMHIVVGKKDKTSGYMSGYIDDGATLYAQTKSGATLKIAGGGASITLTGGGDIEQGVQPSSIVTAYESDNGKTYLVDKILQDPIKSVYTVLGEHSDFKAFFDLLKGGDIFSDKTTAGSLIGGLGYVVNSFNNFRYTVFVPTQEALDLLFAGDKESRKLWTWEEIESIDPSSENYAELKAEKTTYLTEFLKYHFIDNSIYINGKSSLGSYETAARYESVSGTGKFRKVSLQSNGSDLVITGANGESATVITTSNLYNLMTRDYIVNNVQTPTLIESSSRAVIHLIDKALRYE